MSDEWQAFVRWALQIVVRPGHWTVPGHDAFASRLARLLYDRWSRNPALPGHHIRVGYEAQKTAVAITVRSADDLTRLRLTLLAEVIHE